VRKLVILPGLDGSGELLTEFARELADKLIVEIVTYPSDLPLGYEELAVLVLSKLPITEPFVLHGESFGGPLALTVAARYPPGLVGIVLCASFARFPFGAIRALRALVPFSPTRAPLPLLSWALLGRWATSAWVRRMAQGIERLSPSVRRARVMAALSIDTRAALSRLELPLLYIRAAEDRLVWASAGAEVMASARNGHLVEVSGPHFVLQSAPTGFAKAVLGFVHELRSN